LVQHCLSVSVISLLTCCALGRCMSIPSVFSNIN
jgi:hypothetical protein